MSTESRTEQEQQSPEKSAALLDTHEDRSISVAFLKWATILLLIYFGVRLVYFALAISSFVPPDEVTHIGLCQVFSKVLLLPDNSPGTYKFGLVTNTPWLYYWIMGKLLHLNFFGIRDMVFLRLLNIPIAFGTVWYTARLLRLLTNDRLSLLLLIVAMTNTPMLSLLSASVSYDNMTNLAAAMAIYYLFAFFKYRSGNLLAASILCQLVGGITKTTILPLVLGLNILLLIHEWRNLGILPSVLRRYLLGNGRRAWLLALMIVIALVLNLRLYATNYLHYGSLAPTMSNILSPQIAMQYRIGARETIFGLYTEGRISYMEALQMAGEIEHVGDKSDTFYLLMNYENLKRDPRLWMGFMPYARVWLENIMAGIFGIKAHLQMTKDIRYFIPFYLALVLAFLGFLVRWRPRESGWLSPFLAAVSCFYAGFIMYKINYNAYLYYGTPGVTLQGRYLFPVIGPVYALSCYFPLRLFRAEYIRATLALAAAILFISYDFPWFLMHVTPEWYAGPPQ